MASSVAALAAVLASEGNGPPTHPTPAGDIAAVLHASADPPGHAEEPDRDAVLEQTTIPAPDADARERGGTWRRCRGCAWKLTEEVGERAIPRPVLQQLAQQGAGGSFGAAYALVRVALELLAEQSAVNCLVTSEAAQRVIALRHSPEQLLSLCRTHLPRLTVLLEARGAAEQALWGGGGERPAAPAPLLADLAFRVAQTRLLVDQGLALGLAGAMEPEVRRMPLSYLPAATGTTCHLASGDDASSRTQYVRISERDVEGGSSRELETVPDMLYKELLSKGGTALARLHLERDTGKDRDDGDAPCQHADRGRAFRTGEATTSGVVTFLCGHGHIIGVLLSSLAAQSLCCHHGCRVLLGPARVCRKPAHGAARVPQSDSRLHANSLP